ncbi:MAG: hypothetical protein CBC35_01185 [Planctomycetes bacterium TMED75]|nr:MAG: hypothetical protein CBC35_01185 [Planctomycetes bacterium TMED75]
MDRDLAIGADLHGLGHNTKASQMGGLQPLSRKKDSGIDEIICFFTKEQILDNHTRGFNVPVCGFCSFATGLRS